MTFSLNRMKNLQRSLILLLVLTGFTARSQQADSLTHTLTLQHDYFHFDRQFAEDWHITGLEYKQKIGDHAVLGRVNRGSRLGSNGWQAEAEAYPVLSRKVYAYTGISYSDAMPVFPKWRGGASVFVNLPKAWEAEGGVRYLYFTEAAWIGTAGLSKYLGRYLLSFRSFFALDHLKDNQSFFLTGRRYLRNERDFVWLQLGSGVSPDESRNIQLTANPLLSSRRIMLGGRFSFSRHNQLLFSAGYSRDEYQTNTYGNQLLATLGLSHHF
ncbi:MAG TPA: YaiO family outer membrane beta-barrel protein [Chitinophagaceae bacterium]|jgi:YaiO family outer membrane protein|nr:YaiO family outer membrane beta-barrel protein [Chitinophagaceae bacterium]